MKSYVRKVLAVDAGTWVPLLLRLSLAIVVLPHGMQKLFGWFGGFGFGPTMGYFASLGIPWLLGFAAILAESLGALALLAGVATRVAAATIGITFVTAMTLVHWQHGFFIDWFGNQEGQGIEFFLLGIAIAAVLVIQGAGRWSVDAHLSEPLADTGESVHGDARRAPAA